MVYLTLQSKKKKQVIDITDNINVLIQQKKAFSGLCTIFVTHTTAALTVADLDPGTDQDLLAAIENMVPRLQYRHPHDPGHVGDHIMSSIIGCSLTVPFSDGKLTLGAWQSVVLVELNGPRERNIIVKIIEC